MGETQKKSTKFYIIMPIFSLKIFSLIGEGNDEVVSKLRLFNSLGKDKKMKKYFDGYVFKIWSSYFLTTISILSFIAWFLPDIANNIKYIIGGILLALLIVSYIGIAIYQSKCHIVHLTINNTKVNILFGDIFRQKGIKVIAFNEYFDSQVDDSVIDHASLNGQVFDKGLIDKKAFDLSVQEDTSLETAGTNTNRIKGKKIKYKIGEIHKYNNEFFALSFTKFNKKNEANLYSNEYSCCLLKMWRQLNTYYAQSIINVPLLGDGITRILDNTSITKQELLEIMLETLKISKMTFKEPSEINIVLYPGDNNSNYKYFDFNKIKMMFK